VLYNSDCYYSFSFSFYQNLCSVEELESAKSKLKGLDSSS